MPAQYSVKPAAHTINERTGVNRNNLNLLVRVAKEDFLAQLPLPVDGFQCITMDIYVSSSVLLLDV